MNKKTIIFLILNLLIGAIVIVLLVNNKKHFSSKIITRDNSKNFQFTSPILDCEDISVAGSNIISYKELNIKAQMLSEEYNLSDYSVYFRDLNNGVWVGVNEKALFSPASLMKTPILISFLRGIENRKELLEKEVVATQEYFDFAIKQNFELETKVIKGNTYTLQQLINLMIVESDNVATLMLSKYIDQDDYNELLKAIGVAEEKDGKDINIRVKDFAGFFRVLYNASYLNREMSEFALSILSKSKFDTGIVAGVPKKVVVAHKYGERSIEQTEGGLIQEKQLHDCGIVYTKTPYILCIMTRGKDFKKQESFISDISSFIYNQVSK